jgi:hypothetical protein
MAFERRGASLGIPVLRRAGGHREVLVRPTSGHRPQRAGAEALCHPTASRGLTVCNHSQAIDGTAPRPMVSTSDNVYARSLRSDARPGRSFGARRALPRERQ